jgi:SAM-dependent methyltransferase
MKTKDIGMVESLFPGFEVQAHDVLLDIGCGAGDACYQAGRAGAAVIALDVQPETVRYVDQRMRDVPARSYQSFVSDGNPIPLPGGSCTRIVAREVLEHVREPERLLAEMVRVGARGAQYLIGVPDAASEELLTLVAPPSFYQEPHHIHIFARERMRGMLEAAGLRIQRTALWGFYWSMWWMFQIASEESGKLHNLDRSGLVKGWEETWRQFEQLEIPQLGNLTDALDRLIPKSQVYVCVKE